jgi:hypothetical protein
VFGTVLDSVGKQTASAWFSLIRGPAVVFGVTGALAWWLAHPHVDVPSWFNHQGAATLAALLVIVAALLIAASALLDQLARPLLRLLEGYWPSRLGSLRNTMVARAIERERRWREEWESIPAPQEAAAETPPPSALEVAASAASSRRKALLDRRLRDFPADERLTMPTQLGNILRASETYPRERYGLDAVIVWPVMLLQLPADTQTVLAASRWRLDQSVGVLIALFATLVWVAWSWLVLIPALLGPPLVYMIFVIPRASAFARLVRATFDVHRLLLYTSLRFPLPADPDAEVAAGEALTDYLWNGYAPIGFAFTGQAAHESDGDQTAPTLDGEQAAAPQAPPAPLVDVKFGHPGDR